MTSFTPARLHSLLLQLLAPTLSERLIADKLLWQLLVSVEDQAPLRILLIDALLNLDNRSEYLSELVAWWLNSTAKSHDRMLEPLGQRVSNWRLPNDMLGETLPSPNTIQFELDSTLEPVFFPDMFGQGTNLLLRFLDTEFIALTGHFRAGLTHPNPTTRATSLEILAKYPHETRRVLVYLYSEGSNYGYPSARNLLFEMCSKFPSAIEQLYNDFQENIADQRVAFACQVFNFFPAREDWLHAVIDKLKAKNTKVNTYQLFACACALSARLEGNHSKQLCAKAATMMRSASAAKRGASAHAFAHFGPSESLIALLTDADWEVRDWALCAAALVSEPSPALVCAVAGRLGDFEGYDGFPHKRAMDALARYGTFAVLAKTEIIRLIDDRSIDANLDWEIMQLIESIGEGAQVFRPSVQRYLQWWRGDESASDDPIEPDEGSILTPNSNASELFDSLQEHGIQSNEILVEFSKLEVQFKNQQVREKRYQEHADVLARELGFDPNEEIPGSRPAAEIESSESDRLLAWANRAD